MTPAEITEARGDLNAQLAQVEARLADALASRKRAEKGCSQSTWRILNDRLHRLYVMQGDIKRDLAALPADPKAAAVGALFAELSRINAN